MLDIKKLLISYTIAISLSFISIHLALFAVILLTLYIFVCVKKNIPEESSYLDGIQLIYKFSKVRVYRKGKIILVSLSDLQKNEKVFCKRIFETSKFRIFFKTR